MASGLGREEFKEIRVTASSWTFLDRTPQEHGADWPEDFLVTQRVPAKFWTKEIKLSIYEKSSTKMLSISEKCSTELLITGNA